ncbi:MAG: folate-binding protein [Rhodospirillaceae bacterium]
MSGIESPAVVALTDRAVLHLGGPECVGFLQGLVSNDINAVSTRCSVYAALLTPQGRYLHDFFVSSAPTEAPGLWLDVEAARREDLLTRLRRYRLRTKVSFEEDSDDFAVWACYGPGACATLGLPETTGASTPFAGGIAMVDPRLAALGARLLLPRSTRPDLTAGTMEDYDLLRLRLGVPESGRDLVPEKSLLLENNLDVLNAISWTKGCYVGQEVTARTRYRKLVRRRLYPVRVEGPLPPAGTPILCGDKPVGKIRSGRGTLALALLNLDRETSAEPLTAGAATVII